MEKVIDGVTYIWSEKPKEQPINFYSNVNLSAPDNRPPLPPAPSKPSQGVKYDSDKIKYSLLPSYALEAVAKNLTVGLKKYPHRDNWQLVDDAEERYLDALMRHLEQHRRGEIYDTDNIDPTTTHLSAIAVNAMFLLEFMLNPKLNGEIK